MNTGFLKKAFVPGMSGADGKFVMSGSAADIGANPELKRAYLGM